MIAPQPLRVLCADDNVLVLDMLSKTLQSAGHHVEVATDGRAAVSRVEEDPGYFQLIVTDTRMPRLDGFGVVQQVRGRQCRPDGQPDQPRPGSFARPLRVPRASDRR